MKIRLSDAQLESLKAFLDRFEDAEQLTQREYVVDFYEQEVPLSIDLVFVNGGIGIDGAGVLAYSEEQDGWYVSRRIESEEEMRAAFVRAGAFE